MSTADQTEAKLADENADRLATEIESVTQFYVDNATKVWHVYCLSHKGIIGVEAVVEGRPNPEHLDGALVIPIDDQLLSYRTRTDGTMGYTCRCGAHDILLPEEQIYARQDMSLPHVADLIKKAIAERPSNYQPVPLFRRVEVTPDGI